MVLFLKKHLPIFLYQNVLQVGIKGGDYLETLFTDDIKLQLETLLKKGVDLSEVNSVPFFSNLYQGNLLCPEAQLRTTRRELFFEYLNEDLEKINLDLRFLILGAGAAGSTIAYLLAQFGFTNIAILDYDTIADSDIEKTLIYRRSELGEKKIDALGKYLKENFGVNLKTYDQRIETDQELKSIINEVQPEFVVKSWDPDFIFRRYLNDICFERKIPFVYLAYCYASIRLGPFFVPGLTACDRCLLKKLSETNAMGEDFYLYKRIHQEYSIHPTISFNINIMANLIFKDIIFFLLGKYNYVSTLNQIIEFVPLTLVGIRHHFQRSDDCECCARLETGTVS